MDIPIYPSRPSSNAWSQTYGSGTDISTKLHIPGQRDVYFYLTLDLINEMRPKLIKLQHENSYSSSTKPTKSKQLKTSKP
mmetsp:Transcript_14778/g.21111  ORF Transcript_14778/g.21111 Transcript_14778/m.21111 type:complete len:80 (+) Transcript_14778:1144-1383(+)